MSSRSFRPAWTIASSIWLSRRWGFVTLLSAALISGWLFHLLPYSFVKGEGADFLGYLPMGLSIFVTFVLCNFTESDRRGRSDGFPSRLFTFPVPTRTLIAAPLIFNVIAVTVVYGVWAKLALPVLGRELPLIWPTLYLVSGMICYQALVWTLARHRLLRLVSLGLGGTTLALAWIFFSPKVEEQFAGIMPDGLSLRHLLWTTLVVASLSAIGIALIAVENQRRGGMPRWNKRRNLPAGMVDPQISKQSQRTWVERIADALPRRYTPFSSAAHAQFWFEWRRHGSLLPLATGSVLLLITAPAVFYAPLSVEIAGLTLCWIIALPLLLAFVLGKGMGKADLWSRDPGLPLFLATRPLTNTDWIGAKMKSAALATVCSWGIVLLLTPLWLWLGCDYEALFGKIQQGAARNPHLFSISTGVVCLLLLIVLTWRFLVGSLYLGLSGRAWMLNITACFVFLSIFAPAFGSIPFLHNKLVRLFDHQQSFPSVLAWLFGAKILIAAALGLYAHRKGLISPRAIGRYLVVWLVITAAVVTLILTRFPFQDASDPAWARQCVLLLALMFVPLLRVSFAPIALARNRRR